MKTVLLCLGVFGMLISACTTSNDEWQNALNVIANVWGASSSEIENETSTDSSGKELSTITLKLSNLKSVPANYPVDQLSSTTALLFLQNVNESKMSEEEKIHVVIADRGVDKTYSVLNLREASRLITVVTDFVEAPSRNGLAERKKCVDSGRIPDSLLQVLSDQLVLSDSIHGPSNSHQIGGFKFGHVTDTSEPVLIVWATSAKKQSQIPYTFVISRKTGRIISFSLDHSLN